MREAFWKFARATAYYLGTAWAFLTAVVTIIVWAALGPNYSFSDTWQLVINTGTTIITFLMVFVIQNTQNRDAKAINLKLDELLRAVKGARTGLVQLEDRTEAQLANLTREFQDVQARAAAPLDNQTPALEATNRKDDATP